MFSGLSCLGRFFESGQAGQVAITALPKRTKGGGLA
jgi:hypothetical protein